MVVAVAVAFVLLTLPSVGVDDSNNLPTLLSSEPLVADGNTRTPSAIAASTAGPQSPTTASTAVAIASATKTTPLLPDLECARTYFEANFQRSNLQTPAAEREAANGLRESGAVDHVYVIHYSRNPKRRATMTARLAQYGIQAEFVTGFDRQDMTDDMRRCFNSWDADAIRRAESASSGGGNQSQQPSLRLQRHDKMPVPKLISAQQSVVTKHHSALYDAYRRNYSRVLVLEDDALLRANFVRRLGEVVRGAPSDFDVLMVGGCLRMFAYRRRYNTVMHSKHHYARREARCAHAFVVSQRGVREILASLPLTQAIDFQLTTAMQERQLSVFWIEPWLSVQNPEADAECVTGLFHTKCAPAVSLRDPAAYDSRLANDATQDAKWEYVPAHNSKR